MLTLRFRCVIDESFSKMDESRCKAVLDYLSGTLGLQVIFAVPTKSAGALHDHVDQIFQVTKFTQAHPRGELKTGVMVTPTVLKKSKVASFRMHIDTGSTFGFKDYLKICRQNKITSILVFNVMDDSPAKCAARLKDRLAKGLHVPWVELPDTRTTSASTTIDRTVSSF